MVGKVRVFVVCLCGYFILLKLLIRIISIFFLRLCKIFLKGLYNFEESVFIVLVSDFNKMK